MRAQDLANALCHHAVALALRMAEFWDEHCWQYERACRDWEAHARARDEYWEEHVRTLEAEYQAEYQAVCAPMMEELRLRHLRQRPLGLSLSVLLPHLPRHQLSPLQDSRSVQLL